MAGIALVIRVVVTPLTEAQMTERLTAIITDHRERAGGEGIVPALLAEDIVATLRERGELVTLADV